MPRCFLRQLGRFPRHKVNRASELHTLRVSFVPPKRGGCSLRGVRSREPAIGGAAKPRQKPLGLQTQLLHSRPGPVAIVAEPPIHDLPISANDVGHRISPQILQNLVPADRLPGSRRAVEV